MSRDKNGEADGMNLEADSKDVRPAMKYQLPNVSRQFRYTLSPPTWEAFAAATPPSSSFPLPVAWFVDRRVTRACLYTSP